VKQAGNKRRWVVESCCEKRWLSRVEIKRAGTLLFIQKGAEYYNNGNILR
jgi:hypothetical protein